MTMHTDFAAPIDRTLYEAPGRPAPHLLGHPAAVPIGAPVDTSATPPSLALHARQTTVVPADAPPPIAAPVIDHAQHLPLAVPPANPPRPPSADERRAALLTAQLAAVARSADRLGRVRTYADRLAAHASEIRARLDAAAGYDTAGPLRGELIEVERQRGPAAAVLSEVEAEHARHRADLAALASLSGADEALRDELAEVQARRDAARDAADRAKAAHDRATAHAEAVDGRLATALADEARHDAEAADRLHAALLSGADAPAAAEPLVRTSGALEDDLRAARAAADRLAMEHAAKAAALAGAERLVRGAADRVLTAEAEAMAREVAALDARAALLRGRVAAYAARTAGDYVAPPWTPPKNILHPGGWYTPEPGKPSMPPPPRKVAMTPAIAASLPLANTAPPAPSEVLAWTAYAAALASDSRAELAFADAPAPVALPSTSFPPSANAALGFPVLPVRAA